MRFPIMLILLSFSLPGSTFAGGTLNSCTNADINRQWEAAAAKYPSDRLVIHLASKRETLCDLLEHGKIDAEEARLLWEKALTDALLERARAEQRKRGLMRLFATF